MANRDPQEAANSLGGSGIIIVGLEPGKVHGLERVDPADLESKISPYLGMNGPRWEPRWITVEGLDVLIVELGAPQAGDPPFSLERSFANYAAGQIFVRSRGATKPATQLQIQALARRFTAIETRNQLEVEVGFTLGSPISAYYWTEAEVEAFLARERRELLSSLEGYEETPAATTAPKDGWAALRDLGATAGGAYSMTERRAETRTPEEYLKQVELYLRQARAALPDLLVDLASYLVSVPVFWISNLSTRNYRDVEISLRVDGLARAVDAPYDHQDVPDVMALLPERPRPYGPYTAPSSFARALQATIPIPEYLSSGSFSTPYVPTRRSVENGGSFRAELDHVDLRPSQERAEVESELVVLIPAQRVEPVVVHWRATASNVDAVAEGKFVLPTDGEPLNLLAAAMSSGRAAKKHPG